MTLQEIKELIQAANESGIAELEVQRGDNRVRIRRSFGSTPETYSVPTYSPAPGALAPMMMAPESVAAGAASSAPLSASSDPNTVTVKSPIVGTYYESPSPESPTFVRVGEVVKAGQTLCIIEAMKLMNEIPCETAGTVVAKLVQNGQPVEYGEALFTILPA